MTDALATDALLTDTLERNGYLVLDANKLRLRWDALGSLENRSRIRSNTLAAVVLFIFGTMLCSTCRGDRPSKPTCTHANRRGRFWMGSEIFKTRTWLSALTLRTPTGRNWLPNNSDKFTRLTLRNCELNSWPATWFTLVFGLTASNKRDTRSDMRDRKLTLGTGWRENSNTTQHPSCPTGSRCVP